MQKQKIDYLTLQSSYSDIDIALFNNQQKIAGVQLSKFTASALLIPTISRLLQEQAVSLNDLKFICANLGPAPFTTLRTTIVTINGISFVNQIPLVGVNGIEAFTKHALPDQENLIVIWNAFNHSIYFGIRQNKLIKFGWKKIDLFLDEIQVQFGHQSVTIIGQGLDNFAKELATLPSNFILNQACEQFPNIDLIAQVGLELYLKNKINKTLTPLYLKHAEPWI